jgi:hypothetical protein
MARTKRTPQEIEAAKVAKLATGVTVERVKAANVKLSDENGVLMTLKITADGVLTFDPSVRNFVLNDAQLRELRKRISQSINSRKASENGAESAEIAAEPAA